MQGTKKIFWILTPLITIASLFIWFRASGKLTSERKANTSSIVSKFSGLDSIKSTNPVHPNEVSHEKMQGLIDGLKEDLKEAWELQYERQKGVLTWSDELGVDVVDNLSTKTPIEWKVPYPGQTSSEKQQFENKFKIRLVEAPLRYREIYKIYAKKQLPQLAQKINAEWLPGTSSKDGEGGDGEDTAGALGGGGKKPGDSSSLVDWSSASQNEILDRFSWTNRTPTTAEVMYAQEDLWVVNQWMEVIARTNRGADARYNAAITEIVSIELPQQGRGIALAGRLQMPGGGFSGESGDGDSGGDMMAGMMSAMGGEGGAPGSTGGAPGSTGGAPGGGMEGGGGGGNEGGENSGETATSGANDPINLRYVDHQFQPLEAAKLRTALNPNNTVPEDAYLAVAKRYPTRIRLKMDMRRLPDLLTACGNAALTIEVRQVGINSKATASSSGGGSSGGMEGMMGSGMSTGGGMGGFGGGGPGTDGEEGGTEMSGMAGMMGGGGGFGGMGAKVDEFPYQETIEIYAVVYLFNPVDKDKLGTPEEDAIGGEQPPIAAGAALGPTATDKQLAETTR